MNDTALRLADVLENEITPEGIEVEAAAELRRLHAEHTELGQAIKRAIERNNALEAELAEQARLVGMGSEREAKLVALNGELAKALRETTGAHELGVLLSVHGLDKARAALANVEASK